MGAGGTRDEEQQGTEGNRQGEQAETGVWVVVKKGPGLVVAQVRKGPKFLKCSPG